MRGSHKFICLKSKFLATEYQGNIGMTHMPLDLANQQVFLTHLGQI